MAKLIMVWAGKINGVDCYAPLDADAEKIINGQHTIVCEAKGERSKRTTLQNAALHKYCSLLAEALNDGGYDMRRVIKPELEIPWNSDTVKEHLWKSIQWAMLKKKSTTKLETGEVSRVYETLSRHMSGKFGVTVPFPDKYMKMYEADHAK